jgi:hypothetical protein
MVEIEVWVKVDEEGDWSVAKDRDDLDSTGELATRLVRVTLKVPLPAVVELEAEIAEEPEAGELKVA